MSVRGMREIGDMLFGLRRRCPVGPRRCKVLALDLSSRVNGFAYTVAYPNSSTALATYE